MLLQLGNEGSSILMCVCTSPIFCIMHGSDSATDLMSMVHTSSKVHILHGGNSDTLTVFNVISHLQNTWSCGLVWIQTREHFLHFLSSIERIKSVNRVVVAVNVECISECPNGYDALCKNSSLTVIIVIPVHGISGSPYSKRSDIVAIMLPSCRVNLEEAVSAGEGVYISPTPVSEQLQCIPNDRALAWVVGKSSEISMVSFDSPAIGTANQDTIDLAFWWSSSTMSIPHGVILPRYITKLVPRVTTRLLPQLRLPVLTIGSDTIQFTPTWTASDLYKERSSHGDELHMYHTLDVDGNVLPISIQLKDCIEEIIEGDIRYLTCTVRIYVKDVISEDIPTTVWKYVDNPVVKRSPSITRSSRRLSEVLPEVCITYSPHIMEKIHLPEIKSFRVGAFVHFFSQLGHSFGVHSCG